MLNFVNDYSTGAHQKILDTLISTNLIETEGYGEDKFCIEARELIKKNLIVNQQLFILYLEELRLI